MIPAPFLQLFVALGLGLLVGLQRERVDPAIAGIRTFALITLLGALAALLGRSFGGWVVAVGLLVAAALVVSGNLVRLGRGDANPGQTTEFSAVVMYCVGALTIMAPLAVAVVLAGAVAVLLHFKEPLHRFVGRMEEQDVRAIMQLVLIALVILPILPDRPFGPYQVLNPYQIWWMVVLIVGLSLAGYVAFKLFGANAGSVLSGALGGLISSTVHDGQLCPPDQRLSEGARLAALVIVIASAVVFGRVLVEMAAVAPSYLIYMGPPIGAMLDVAIVVFASQRVAPPQR